MTEHPLSAPRDSEAPRRDRTVPDQTVPDQTVPDQTVPDRTVPDRTVPMTEHSLTAPRGQVAPGPDPVVPVAARGRIDSGPRCPKAQSLIPLGAQRPDSVLALGAPGPIGPGPGCHAETSSGLGAPRAGIYWPRGTHGQNTSSAVAPRDETRVAPWHTGPDPVPGLVAHGAAFDPARGHGLTGAQRTACGRSITNDQFPVRSVRRWSRPAGAAL